MDVFAQVKEFLPLLTLVLGAFIGYYLDKLKLYSNFRNTRTFFFASLHYLHKGVIDQIMIFNEYIKIIGSDVTSFHPMPFNLNFDTQLVNSVANNDVFRIFIKGKKKAVDDMYLLKITVYKIDAISRLVGLSFDNLRSSYKSILDKFNIAISRLDSELKSIEVEMDNQIENGPDCTQLSNSEIALFGDLQELGTNFNKGRTTKVETTIFKYMNEYVFPVKEIFESYKDYRFKDLFDELDYIFNELLTKRKSFVEFLISERDVLIFVSEKQLTLLEKYKKYLKNLNLK